MITPKRNGGLGTSGMLNFCELCKFWLSRQNQAKYSTETWMFWLILKHKLMFLQWILGHLIVLYKLPLSKLEFKSMIFTPFLHFFPRIYHSVHLSKLLWQFWKEPIYKGGPQHLENSSKYFCRNWRSSFSYEIQM